MADDCLAFPDDSRAYAFDAAYASPPNWDIGRPQRAFVYLARAGAIESPVLDVGCGTGELSLYLARQGHQVLGIDLSRRAIEQARAKARWRDIDAQFLVWDALRLADLGVTVRTVVDSAMFHCLGDRERDGWRVEFVLDTTFERRWSANAAFLAGVVRTG